MCIEKMLVACGTVVLLVLIGLSGSCIHRKYSILEDCLKSERVTKECIMVYCQFSQLDNLCASAYGE